MAFELIAMLASYSESIRPPMHLSSKFQVGGQGVHYKNKVRWQVRRTSKDIAWPTTSVKTGYHMNERSGFAEKETTPPVYMEGSALEANQLLGVQQFGQNPFSDPNFLKAASDILSNDLDKLVSMIQGGLELQASQILTTGQLSLVDSSNNVVFSEDFFPKSTHFPAASIGWATYATAVPFTDILNLCIIIAADGKGMPNRITMNSTTFRLMMACTSAITAMDNDKRIWNGQFTAIERVTDLRGAILAGQLQVAPYVLDVYIYDEDYVHPYSGVLTKYMPDDRYLIESATQRLDATFGGILKFGQGDGAQYLGGGRATVENMLSDLDLNAWVSPDRTVVNMGVGTRPLLIPVSIDTFGTGKTTA